MTQTPEVPSKPSPSPAWIPLALFLATFAAFLPALRGEFLNWDDVPNFLENPSYRGLGPSQLRWMFTTFLMGHYHPLTWITLGLDYAIWGMNPFGYHLTSLLFHSANAVLLYFVLRSLLRLCGHPAAIGPAAGALLYSLHPLRVESVAWITERRDVVCVFFSLLCVLAWLKRVAEEREGRSAGRWLALSVAAFGAALMGKALALMLPAVLLLLDGYPLRRAVPGSRVRILLEKLPYVLICCADVAVMLAAMRTIDAVRSAEAYQPLQRLAQACYGLCFYVAKTLWPAVLLPMYRIDKPLDPWAPKYLLAILGAVATTATLAALRRRWPAGLTTWLMYGLLVLPVLGVAVTGMQIAADRYATVAMMPASALAAAGLARVNFRRAAIPAGVVLLLLAGRSFLQCGIWRDSITLWTHQIAHDPGAELAFRNRGSARHVGGDPAGALADYDASLRLLPDQPGVLADRGSCRMDLGDLAGALADYNRAAALDPRLAKTFNLRGLARERSGDLAGARADYDRCLELNPQHVLALGNRGFLRRRLGDLDGAEADAEAALRADPQGGTAYVLRASVRRQRGDVAGALADLGEAVSRTPTLVEAWNNRAMIHLQSGRAREAREDYDRALGLNPRNPPVLVGRAQALLALGDPAGAARDLSLALESSPPGWPPRPEVEALLLRLKQTPPPR